MFAKLCVLVVSMGVIACTLLGIRQLRVQAAHEAAAVVRRGEKQNREIWKLRSEIARRVTPTQVQLSASKFGALKPLSGERFETLVRLEIEERERTTVLAGDGVGAVTR